jgi:hypothetical protein
MKEKKRREWAARLRSHAIEVMTCDPKFAKQVRDYRRIAYQPPHLAELRS